MTVASKSAFIVMCVAIATTPAEAGLFGGKLTLVEPLFGPKYEACLKDPLMLMRSMEDADGKESDSGLDSQQQTRCMDLQKGFAKFKSLPAELKRGEKQATVVSIGSENITQYKLDDEIAMRRRNELIDTLVAVSDNKCSTYSAYLKTFDGRNNSTLGILAITTAGLGSFVGGAATAKALSGASAIINGSRSALNEVWFSSQTIHVLAAAYENARQKERQEITNRQACGIKTYTLSHGIGDAIHYHGACSLLTGLAETSLAVARQEEPGLDAMRRQLADLQSIRNQAADLLPPPLVAQNLQSTLKQQQVVLAESEVRGLQRELDTANAKLAAATAAVDAAHAADTPAPTSKQLTDFYTLDPAFKAADNAVSAAQAAYNKRQTEAGTLRAALLDLVAQEQKNSQTEAVRQARLVRDVSHVAICPYGKNGGIDEEAEPLSTPSKPAGAEPTPVQAARQKLAKKVK